MLAVAAELIVKLAAFLTVGFFVVFSACWAGSADFSNASAANPEIQDIFARFHGSFWITVTFLSLVCIVLLPRQFHVTVVENNSENEFRRAAWLFPVYLVLINFFVVPIAAAGLMLLPRAPLQSGHVRSRPAAIRRLRDHHPVGFRRRTFRGHRDGHRRFGGSRHHGLQRLCYSAAIARRRSCSGGRREHGMLFWPFAGSRSLSSCCWGTFLSFAGESARPGLIGLVSFAAIAQLAPAFFGGLIWRRRPLEVPSQASSSASPYGPTRCYCRGSSRPAGCR